MKQVVPNRFLKSHSAVWKINVSSKNRSRRFTSAPCFILTHRALAMSTRHIHICKKLDVQIDLSKRMWAKLDFRSLNQNPRSLPFAGAYSRYLRFDPIQNVKDLCVGVDCPLQAHQALRDAKQNESRDLISYGSTDLFFWAPSPHFEMIFGVVGGTHFVFREMSE